MSLLGSVGHFLGGLVGIGDDDEKKKKQQQVQAATPAPVVVRPQNQSAGPVQGAPITPPEENNLQLVIPGQHKPVTQDGLPQPLVRAPGAPLPVADPTPAAPKPSLLDRAADFTLKRVVPSVGHAIDQGVSNVIDSTPATAGASALLQRVIPDKVKNVLPTPAELVGGTLRKTAQIGERTANSFTGNTLTPVTPAEKLLLGDKPVGQFDDYTKENFGVKTGNRAVDTATGIVGSALDAIPLAAPKKTGEVGIKIAEAADDAAKEGGLLRRSSVSPEVAPGVHSVNPNQATDAAAHAADEAAKQAQAAQLEIPTYQRQGLPEPTRESNIDVPTFQRNNADQLAADAQDKVNSLNTLQPVLPETQATRMASSQELAMAMARDPQEGAQVLRQQLLRKAVGADTTSGAGLQPLRDTASAELNNARIAQAARDELAGLPDGQSAAIPVANTPDAVTPAVPVDSPLVAAPEPAVAPAVAPETSAPQLPAPDAAPAVTPESAPLAPEAAVPTMPENGAQPTMDVAPLSHDALVKQMGPAARDLKGNYSQKLPLNIEENNKIAAGVIANMSDDDLLKSFATTAPDAMVNDAQGYSIARAALDRLGQLSENPQAVQTVVNIMDAMDRFVSKSGEGLRVAQEAFDNLPLPMKVRYIIKKIDSANADTKGYQALKDDPAKASVVEAIITGHLNASQQIAERVAAIQGQLRDVVDAALKGQKVDTNVRALTKTLKTEQRNLAANNGELVKYYADLTPGRGKGQKVNDFARQMMLASFTGRVNDVLTTTSNVGNLGVQNLIQGGIAKVANLVKPGVITDTTKGVGRLFTGGASELKRTGGEIKGRQYAPDIMKALKRSNTEGRSGLQPARGLVGRTIQAATEAATNLSAGVRDQRLVQLAHQEALQKGVPRHLVKQYIEARSAVPSRQMLEAADRLHAEVNNLNDNPVTRTLNRVASSIEGKSAVGGFLKNQIIPFTSWLGGNIYNSTTDKNVIASAVKIADSLRKGDAEGVARNFSKLATNAVQTYALGYVLTKMGVLTNKNAEGYNDAGAYLHVDGRYIPIGLFGFAAPNVILGNAAYNGINEDDGSSVAERVAKSAEDSLVNMAKSLNATGAIGVDNNITRAYQAGSRPGASAMDGVVTGLGGALGQFIPALSGDANAVLNNSPLNPTHEKADTKVVNPNSPSGQAKDVKKSAIASLESRVPVLSQLALPRKKDVAAQDIFDRTTRGDRDTTGGVAAKVDAQKAVDQAKDFKARGIPDPSGKNFDSAVEARVEDGDYGKAIEGLNAKLATQEKDKDIPKSKNQAIKDQITKLKVADDGHYDPKVIDLYKKTSLTEWRDMGDPKSDNYDPDTYQLLYNYDKDLAGSNVSRNATKTDKPFYSVKAPSKSSSGSRGGGSELSRIKSNTIGSTPDLGKVSLGELAPQKAGSKPIPTIRDVKPGELIKKRAISVGKA